jgi:hypothetical protein
MAPVPHLEVDAEALAVATVDPARVLGVLAPLGLDGVARRFERSVTAPPPPPRAPHPVGAEEPGTDRERTGAVVAGASSGPPLLRRPTGPFAGEQERLF